jgi:hypothetical protein
VAAQAAATKHEKKETDPAQPVTDFDLHIGRMESMLERVLSSSAAKVENPAEPLSAAIPPSHVNIPVAGRGGLPNPWHNCTLSMKSPENQCQ